MGGTGIKQPFPNKGNGVEPLLASCDFCLNILIVQGQFYAFRVQCCGSVTNDGLKLNLGISVLGISLR